MSKQPQQIININPLPPDPAPRGPSCIEAAVAMTVDIGDLGDQESGAQLCIDCLRAAVALLEEALEATNAAPQERRGKGE